MRIFMATFLFFSTPFISLATPHQFQAVKSFDGRAQSCKSKEDLGMAGVRLENTEVNSAQAAGTLEISFGPRYYRCVATVQGFQWQTTTLSEVLFEEIQTKEGIVRVVPVSSAWVLYSEDYTVLNPQSQENPGLQEPLKYSVRVEDLQRRSFKVKRSTITAFLKYERKALYPDGTVMYLGQRSSGSFHILINLP